jgi:hypothetical protein
LEIVEYEYDDTAYRLIGDFGEQVVTRNHRCIVEQDGAEIFQFAEEIAWERKAHIPILENLPELQQAISDKQQSTGRPQQDVLGNVLWNPNWRGEQRIDAAGDAQGQSAGNVLSLRGDVLAEREMACSGGDADVFQQMQRRYPWCGVEATRAQGPRQLETIIGNGASEAHDWPDQSGMEGRPDLSEPERKICEPADQIRALPNSVPTDGAEGRLRHGASVDRCDGDWSAADAIRDCSSQESQGDSEPTNKLDAVRDERLPQGIRAWRGHRSDVVRIVPFHHVGKVWCLRVPTGAFVAVRGGVAFPTGNSGFPKSHDVSKGIDRAAGAEREVIGTKPTVHRGVSADHEYGFVASGNIDITAPATDAAREWQGWATTLKPACEPCVLARKPLSESTVAKNVLRWGCGALNIDGCRVPMSEADAEEIASMGGYGKATYERQLGVSLNLSGVKPMPSINAKPHELGRWPANLILAPRRVLARQPRAQTGSRMAEVLHERRRLEKAPGGRSRSALRHRVGEAR